MQFFFLQSSNNFPSLRNFDCRFQHMNIVEVDSKKDFLEGIEHIHSLIFIGVEHNGFGKLFVIRDEK